ncbi:hypothetical protein B8A40_06520 [Dolosigranulum pigrum]|uniref:helix-turn-helix domain-containing protein n=1 Tax=Dolosigranulum pigrum TaxID=29394 RepID=UPI000DC20852|nr:helix-turn-helix transcriptional regulator [Dolosigranulum pigrum]RAN57479.1 hypothetical protein B8A40_06520 [Dolosigranulum pigrum]
MLHYSTNIKALRQAKNLTQAEIAEGIASQSVISNIEKGTISPGIDILEKIASKLGISLQDLLFNDDDETKLTQLYSYIDQLLKKRNYIELKNIVQQHTNMKILIERHPAYFKWINSLIEIHVNDNIDEGIQLSKEALVQTDDNAFKVRILIGLAGDYSNINDLGTALEYLKQGKELSQKTDIDTSLQFKINYQLARLHSVTQNIQETIFHSKLAIQYTIEHESLELLDDLHLLLGDAYLTLGKLDLAEEYTQRAHTLATLKNNAVLLPYIERTLLQIENQSTID